MNQNHAEKDMSRAQSHFQYYTKRSNLSSTPMSELAIQWALAQLERASDHRGLQKMEDHE